MIDLHENEVMLPGKSQTHGAEDAPCSNESPPWHDKWRDSWQYHQTALTLGPCENRGSGRLGRRIHHKFISAGTAWKTIPKHYVTQANSLRNSRKKQFRSKTRRPFLCTGLFSLPELHCLLCTFSSPFIRPLENRPKL